MGLKLETFTYLFARWLIFVVLALLPTTLLVLAYRWWCGRPLWSLSDIPVAAEAATCAVWIGLLMGAHGALTASLGGWLPPGCILLLASAVCAVPVAFAYVEIERINRALGRRSDVRETVHAQGSI